MSDRENHVDHSNDNIPLQYKCLLTALKSNAYPKLPEVVLNIDVSFPVDSGATILTPEVTEEFVPCIIQNMPELCANGLFITNPYFSPLKGHWAIVHSCTQLLGFQAKINKTNKYINKYFNMPIIKIGIK